jgi:hypothetical protein
VREVKTYHRKGFDFQVSIDLHEEPEISVDQSAFDTNEQYRDAFNYISKFLPFLKAIHTIQYLGTRFQEAGVHDPLFSQHPDVEWAIWAYEKKLVMYPENIYQLAIAIRDRVAPERNPYSRFKKPGYVYLIRSASGHYKIGRSVNPHDRMKTFGILLPFEVEYLALIKSDDYIGLEKYLHEQFAYCRVNGEWFNLAPDDIQQIKDIEKDAESCLS